MARSADRRSIVPVLANEQDNDPHIDILVCILFRYLNGHINNGVLKNGKSVVVLEVVVAIITRQADTHYKAPNEPNHSKNL